MWLADPGTLGPATCGLGFWPFPSPAPGPRRAYSALSYAVGRALPPRLLCSSKQLGAKTPVCCLSRKEARGTAAVPALGCPPDPRVHTPRFILSNMPPVTVLPHRLRIASSLEPTPHPALRILLSPRPHHCNGPACHSSVHHPLPTPLLEHLPSRPPKSSFWD